MHVKQTILLRNQKVTKYQYFSQKIKQIEKSVKTIGNGNLRVSKDTAVCVTLAITFWINKSQCKISTRPRYD